MIVKTAVIAVILTVIAVTALNFWIEDQIFGGGAKLEVRTVTTEP